MRAWAVIALVLFGCRDGVTARDKGDVPSGSPPPRDPWAAPLESDDPPDLVERRRLADEACASVLSPYFYRVEKDGRAAHLLGTRHLGVPLAKFPLAVRDELASAKLAVLETAADDHFESTQPEIALRDELGPQLWARYRTLVGTRVARGFEYAVPTAAILTLIALYEDPGATLDNEIQDEALRARIPVLGLEASALQDQLMAKHLGIRMLRAAIITIDDRKELADDTRRTLTEYCAGSDDTPGFDDTERAELMLAGYTADEIDQMDEDIVFARNRNWIPKLEDILESGGAFIAVGADHLRGDKGVVALFRARGYKVTRIDHSSR